MQKKITQSARPKCIMGEDNLQGRVATATEKAPSCTTISFIAYLATALTSSLAGVKAGRR